MNTAKKAHGFLDGEKPYQIKARTVLPILVRQAKAAKKIYYSDLADEIDMPNPRNLNYPLGSIGTALKSLSKEWGIKIPQIQCIVVNKSSEIPGEGIGWFIDKIDFKKLSKKQKREVVNRVLTDVFAFNKWDDVLSTFGLAPLKTPNKVKKILRKSKVYGSGGESEHHKKLKNHIANNPYVIGLKDDSYDTVIEYEFPSKDSIDILFKSSKDWIGVEVKSEMSPVEDILRGLYQCVKYTALLDAHLSVTEENKDIKIVLAIGGEFPDDLIPIKNIFGIEVVDRIRI